MLEENESDKEEETKDERGLEEVQDVNTERAESINGLNQSKDDFEREDLMQTQSEFNITGVVITQVEGEAAQSKAEDKPND